MTGFKDSDYEQMMFNVHQVPLSSDLLEVFPVLRSYEEFSQPTPGLNKNAVLRYIFYAYDSGCPLVKQYTSNILKRKFEAARMACFPLGEDGKYSNFVDKMIRCEIPTINRMIARILRLQCDHDFSFMAALQDGYYSELPNISSGDLKNLEKVKQMRMQIEDLEKKITRNDTNRNLVMDIYKFLEDEIRLGLRPEDIALKIKNGQEPIPDMSW